MAAATIDEYLAGVPDDKRAALQRLREQIHAAAPDATEAISYGMPAFKLDGRYLVGFAATKEHCSFYAGRAPTVAHDLLWWLADDPTLAVEARRAIADPSNDVCVSAASVGEIEIKRALGKLTAPDGLVEAIDASAFTGLPITLADAQSASGLPAHHRDPFDRMLIAQAGRLDAVIVTRDPSFSAYGANVLAV